MDDWNFQEAVVPKLQQPRLPLRNPLMSTSDVSPLEISTTDEPISAAGHRSACSSSGLLQDLTKELQNSSEARWDRPGSGEVRALQSDDEALIKKNSKRVRRELKIWGRLKHNSILPLWGVATDFGPYLAMICPWVDNGALTGFLERQEDTLSSEHKFALLTDIALGLQYRKLSFTPPDFANANESVHSKSIIHGDLTGSNVLIYGNGRACVTDFGLSTMMEEFIGTSYLTSSIRGNIRWAAAELFDVPEDDGEDHAPVLLSVECDIYSFGSIILQVLTCKVPYYDVKKDYVVMGLVARGKKPEPPKGSQVAPAHWEFIQRCWLPRASRPLIGEIVLFAHQQYCELHPNDTVDHGNSSGNPSGIWPGTWSGNWSGHWSDSDSDEVSESDDDSSSGTDQDAEGDGMDRDEDGGTGDEGEEGSEGDEHDKHDKRGGEDDEGNEEVVHDEVIGLDGKDGSDNDDRSSGIDQEVEREDFDERVEGNEGHESSEDDENEGDEEDESSEGVEDDEDIEGDCDDEGDADYDSYDDDGDGGADCSYDSDGSW
ncbi:kinase-like protein [Suillus weaverae]|nr:kinase-like protein [Suillus weaverae]